MKNTFNFQKNVEIKFSFLSELGFIKNALGKNNVQYIKNDFFITICYETYAFQVDILVECGNERYYLPDLNALENKAIGTSYQAIHEKEMLFVLDKLVARVVEYGPLILNKALLFEKLRNYWKVNTENMAAESLKKLELPIANAAFKVKNFSVALASFKKIEKLLSPAESKKMVFCENRLSSVESKQA